MAWADARSPRRRDRGPKKRGRRDNTMRPSTSKRRSGRGQANSGARASCHGSVVASGMCARTEGEEVTGGE